jgi:hypothetical protein
MVLGMQRRPDLPGYQREASATRLASPRSNLLVAIVVRVHVEWREESFRQNRRLLLTRMVATCVFPFNRLI